jgi:S1-C subfamily serine protease
MSFKTKPRQSGLNKVGLWLSLGLLSLLAALALPHIPEWTSQLRQGQGGDPSFETAFALVSELEQKTSAQPSAAQPQNPYGMSQTEYDRWRQARGQSTQPLTNLSEAEAKAIYQESWNRGNCGSYRAPLDAVCLDTMTDFGIENGKSFFLDLPDDPTQAALTVIDRRKANRDQQAKTNSSPEAKTTLEAGLNRDRLLAELVAPTAAQASPQASSLPQPNSTPQPSSSPQLSVPSPQAAASPPSNTELTWDQLYEKVKPVTAEVWIKAGVGRRAPASGIIVTSRGTVLTNYHVIRLDKNNTLPVKLSDGREFTGKVIASDEVLDMAVIQLDNASGLPVATLANDSSSAQVGTMVYAIGSPTGTRWKMSSARVIELDSICANDDSPLRCIRTPSGFLLPGNSGGPMFDITGKVVGINRAVQAETGEGVSIPVERMRKFLTDVGIDGVGK